MPSMNDQLLLNSYVYSFSQTSLNSLSTKFHNGKLDSSKIYMPVYNRILLSHKKERNWVICRDVAGPRDCHTEWSKSEREKQILYINAYMWNLEKWYRWSYLQSRSRDTDVENKCIHTKGVRGGGERNWEIGIDIHTLLILCIK